MCYTDPFQIPPTLTLLGIPTALPALPTTHLPSLFHAALPYLLAPTLLLGPLYAMWLDGALPLQGYGSLTQRIKGLWASWGLVEMRNYVVVRWVSSLCTDVYRSASAAQ
jgi:prenyl protein peptidase